MSGMRIIRSMINDMIYDNFPTGASSHDWIEVLLIKSPKGHNSYMIGYGGGIGPKFQIHRGTGAYGE